MFCVLSVKKRENGLCERLFGPIIKDDYSIACVPVISGAPFYHLNATVGKRGVDFERVAALAGRCAERLVTAGDFPVPQNIKGIGEFHSDLLYEKLSDNTAEFLLCQLEGAEYRKESKTVLCGENVIEIGRDKNDFCFPLEYSSLMPKGVGRYDFASALYELCGVFWLSQSVFETIIVNGEKKSLGSVYFS